MRASGTAGVEGKVAFVGPAGRDTAALPRSGWGAVFALTLCVAALITSEFMPVSLLTPIAGDLRITEGRAGQAIAVSGVFAVLTSLGISPMTRGIDRRIVLLSLTLLMMASGAMVALAPNAGVFMAGRALLGVVVGGFWSMSAATVMRLVPGEDVPRAMGLLNGGNALATTIAAPLGSFLAQYIGWRGAFFAVVPLAALTLVWLFATLPAMPSGRGPAGGSVFRVLRRPRVPAGMLGVALLFLGQFALFTYLRPFLETVTRVDVSTLSLILLICGAAGLAGTWLIAVVLRTRLFSALVAMPLAMAAIAVALTVFGGSPVAVALLLAGWGLIGTAAPVAWWTWLSKVLPDDAEVGGGLMVAVIQLAIALGATAGGVLYDASGYRSTFAFGAAALCASALFAGIAWRGGPRKRVRTGGEARDSEPPALPARPRARLRWPRGRPHGLWVLLGLLVPLAVNAQTSNAPRAQTKNGVVQGLALPSGVRSFRGIPYAAPPVRDLRWRPPQPAKSWRGVRLADRFANQCMQARPFGDMMFRNAGVSEDCLYLNVWSPPGAPGERRPVLFYIYGGGWMAGDGSEPRYDGESMARRGIVVVTLSHRLGVFAFLSHPELSAESPRQASGNYGYMDQTAALRWVRDNVSRFGGDTAKVTIAGESAGSFAVSAQMASPTARGLFARAIGESGAHFGTSVVVPTRAESERDGVTFAGRIGAASLAELRALSATELLELSGRPGMPRFLANIDGLFFPKAPEEIYAAGEQAKVPLLAGWNSEEANGRGLVRGERTADSARAAYARLFGARAADAETAYPLGSADEIAQSLTDLASDRFVGFATWKWLEEHARTSGQPVYRYLYARPRPAPMEAGVTPNLAGGVTRGDTSAPPAPAARGAVHAAEIEYALGNLPLNTVFAWTPDDFEVSETMQGYFANFIRTGDPNGAGLPEWPRGGVTNGQVQRIRIDVQTRAEAEPRARYQFLDQPDR